MKRADENGFTIVELATVVAVLAILATIIMFAVGNWRQRTAESEVKSDLTNLAGAMESARNFGNSYPLSIPLTFTASQNVIVTLKSSGASAYCAEGQSKAITGILYHVGSGSTTPVSGGC